MKRLIWCLLLALGLPAVARADGLPEWSIWKNPRESMLIISTVDTAAGASLAYILLPMLFVIWLAFFAQ